MPDVANRTEVGPQTVQALTSGEHLHFSRGFSGGQFSEQGRLSTLVVPSAFGTRFGSHGSPSHFYCMRISATTSGLN